MIKLKLVDWHTPDTEKYFYSNKLIIFLKKRYNIIYSDNPDYILYGPFGNNHIKYDCVRIFISEENKRPNWNIADYSIDYDYINFYDRHLRTSLGFLFHEDSYMKINSNFIRINNLKYRDKFCAFLISDPGNIAWTPREHFINKLSLYKTIDSGGRWKNNIGGPIGDRYGDSGYGDADITKLKWLRNYKFNICFENSSSPGYTSEKLFQAFAAGCIPIYWGDTSLRCGLDINQIPKKIIDIDQRIPKISNEMLDYVINPKSFINAHNYSTWDEVVDVVKEIDRNRKKYLDMLSEPVFLNENFNLFDFFSKQLYSFFDNIFNQEYNLSFRRGLGIHIQNDHNEKKYILNNFNNISQNPQGAVLRVKNQLSYKLGFAIIDSRKSIFKILLLPFILIGILISYNQERKIYQQSINKDISLKLPPLTFYSDYQESLKVKNHLSYKLGQELINSFKLWYKGGLFKLPFRMIAIFKEHKK